MIRADLVRLLRSRLMERLRTVGADGLFVFRDSNLLGFCGLPLGPSDRLVCGLVNSDGKTVVVLPAFEAEVAHESDCVDRVAAWEEHEDAFAMLAEAARWLGIETGRILLDGHTWLHTRLAMKKALPGATLEDDGGVIGGVRVTKHGAEIEAIRGACADSAKAYAYVGQRLRDEMSEAELWEETTRHLRENGANPVSLLVQGGPTASIPHASAGRRRFVEGDAVVVDCVCERHGYHGDLTRTFAVGRAGEEVKAAYRVVRAAQRAAIELIRPGVSCDAVDAAARSVIEQAGLGRFFTHRLGHGVGLDGHEPPYLRRGNPQRLEPGMCTTVEPGVYVHGRFGVRIEDVVVVTEGGCEVLSESLPTDVSQGLA